MIRVDRLCKRYGPVVAVDQLSFEVRAGETLALIGPNGAGKTTTLKILLGLAHPDSGTVELGAERRPPSDPRARATLGYVPQRVEFPAGRTVAEVLRFFVELRGLAADAADRALARVGMADFAGRRARDLSGGYAQRLSLAQALLGDPDLLVLDEPTASLDPEATWEFRTLVEQLRAEGKTLLLCSHLLSEVERVADRVLILVNGRCAAIESLDDLRTRQGHATRLLIQVPEGTHRAGAVLCGRGFDCRAVNGHRIAIESVDGRGLEALDALRDAGITLGAFQVERPTLEETFLQVVQRDRRDRGGETP